jgi:mannitol/fructose-specific phosphotransferase system IIA component
MYFHFNRTVTIQHVPGLSAQEEKKIQILQKMTIVICTTSYESHTFSRICKCVGEKKKLS